MPESAVDFITGAVLAVGFVALARALGRLERPLLAAALFGAAAAYVVLGAGARSPGELLVEVGGAALFAVLGVLGVAGSAWFLAAGWALHAAWDLAVPVVADTAYMPPWYAAACVGFDGVVAAYLVGEGLRSRNGLSAS